MPCHYHHTHSGRLALLTLLTPAQEYRRTLAATREHAAASKGPHEADDEEGSDDEHHAELEGYAMLGADEEEEGNPEESEEFDEHGQEENAHAVETVEAPDEVRAAGAMEDEHLKLKLDARQRIQNEQPAEQSSVAQVSAREPLPEERVQTIKQAMAGFTLTPPPWAAQVDEAIWMQKVGRGQRTALEKDRLQKVGKVKGSATFWQE